MSIHEFTCYQVTCDDCGKTPYDLHGTECAGYAERSDAYTEAESYDWQLDDDHYCPGCWAKRAAIAEASAAVLFAREQVAQANATHASVRARITELESDLRDEGNRSGRLADQLRTACAEGSAANDRITELEQWKVNAETTLAEDKRYIDEANSGALVERLASERDTARARIAELEQQTKEGERFDALVHILDWRCRSTTTRASFLTPDDQRAVWCELPSGHVGLHHAQVDDGTVDWPDIAEAVRGE